MFSYRHGFHAGNHADVLKHITLLSCLKLLHKKETPLMLVDTHAGAGLYDLQDRFAQTSLEANEGILQLAKNPSLFSANADINDYFQLILGLQSSPSIHIYPGSPYLLWQSMRVLDKLRLMELHPSDFPVLKENMEQLKTKRQDIKLDMVDGFAMLKAYLPPPSRRGLVLIDPSYEDKGDYRAVLNTLEAAIARFATGIYCIWYPVLTRLDAKEFPNRLKKLCQELNLSWLKAELRIKPVIEDGLSASGMWIINPPWQLEESLENSLPLLQTLLQVNASGSYLIETNTNT
jgi:23S rRNA (adenine2030-N6)-methyltransferase